ncbi:MAG: pgsA [Gemmatimonadetes bacterium]|nr:pgsA [Gemmatimonadota bacterium]
MNLPNALTIGRIAVTPLIAILPLAPSSTLRLCAFALFLVAAISDYVDGFLARSRKQETDLGRMLDPLADKLLLLGTFVPMFWLAGSGSHGALLSPWRQSLVPGVIGPMVRADGVHAAFPFLTPFGPVGLAWWIVAVVLGREIAMTIFRQAAARRGVVIAAIGPAKWKTGLQLVWQGSAYFWFFIATLAAARGWTAGAWHDFAFFNGLVGVTTMTAAVALTLWSLVLYLARYGRVFTHARSGVRA